MSSGEQLQSYSTQRLRFVKAFDFTASTMILGALTARFPLVLVIKPNHHAASVPSA